MQSSQRLYVTYCGRPLTSHQSYYWKVRVWDQVGMASGWSAPAKWTTAILHPDEWKARWIAAEPDGPLLTQPSENRGNWTESVQPLPIFRKEFQVTGPVKSAIVLVSGLGQYELHLNGASVTDTVLNPGWTNYRTTVLYNTFDVPPLWAALDLSLAYQKLANYPQAIAVLIRAERHYPREKQIHFRLMRLYTLTGKMDRAQQENALFAGTAHP